MPARSSTGYAFNRTRQAYLATRLRMAGTHWSRLRGLMGTAAGHVSCTGMACGSFLSRGVHTFAMRFPIDVVYLDGDKVVVHLEDEFAALARCPDSAAGRFGARVTGPHSAVPPELRSGMKLRLPWERQAKSERRTQISGRMVVAVGRIPHRHRPRAGQIAPAPGRRGPDRHVSRVGGCCFRARLSCCYWSLVIVVPAKLASLQPYEAPAQAQVRRNLLFRQRASAHRRCWRRGGWSFRPLRRA